MRFARVLMVLGLMLGVRLAFAMHVPPPSSVKVFIQKLPDPSNPQGPGLPVDHSIFAAAAASFVDDQPGSIVVEVPSQAVAGLTKALSGLVWSVEARPDFDVLDFRLSPQDAHQPSFTAPAGWSRQSPLPDPARDLWVIQFASTPRQEWLDTIKAVGASIVDYIPQNGYTLFASATAIEQIAASLPIQVAMLQQPIHKIEPELLSSSEAFTVISVSILDVPEATDALNFLSANSAVPAELGQNEEQRHIYYALYPSSTLPQLAALPTVQWIEARHSVVLSGEREAKLAAGVPSMVRHLSDSGGDILAPALPSTSYRSWLTGNANISTYLSTVKMAILDTGFDLNNLSSTVVHQDFLISPYLNTPINIANYTSNDASGDNSDCYGHGTLVAGIITGNAGESGSNTNTKDNGTDGAYYEGLGVAPKIPLVVGRIFGYLTTNPLCGTFPNQMSFCPKKWTDIFTDLLARNVAITSNSWNESNNGATAYTQTAHDFDLLVRHNGSDSGAPMIVYFSAGNKDDPPTDNQTNVSAPATAKNVISVGASENYNPSIYGPPANPTPLAYTAGADSDRGNDIWKKSRQGPTQPPTDGRIKPDVVAPGSAMEAPESQETGISCRVGAAVTGIDGTAPPRQAHAWSRGTSFSAPVAASEGAFLYTWYKNTLNSSTHFVPSPAMLKAMQINLAYDLMHNTSPNNVVSFGHAPDNFQGWGKVDLGRAFQAGDYVWLDQNRNYILFPSTTAIDLPSAVTSYTVKDTSKDVRVTVVWTDYPGTPNVSPALVNDLNVAVRNRSNGNYVLGNDFAPSNPDPSVHDRRCIVHTSGGTIDSKNNVEELVFTSADIGSTTFYVEITKTHITMDAINPWNHPTPEQDFAIFIENVVGN